MANYKCDISKIQCNSDSTLNEHLRSKGHKTKTDLASPPAQPLPPQPQPQTQPTYQLQPHPQSQAQPTYQPQPHPQSQAQPTYQPQPHPQSQAQPTYQSQPHSQSQTQPTYQSQPLPQSQAQPTYQSQPLPQSLAQYQPQPQQLRNQQEHRPATADDSYSYIVPAPGTNQYRCTACSKPVSGKKGMDDHIASEKHIVMVKRTRQSSQLQQNQSANQPQTLAMLPNHQAQAQPTYQSQLNPQSQAQPTYQSQPPQLQAQSTFVSQPPQPQTQPAYQLQPYLQPQAQPSYQLQTQATFLPLPPPQPQPQQVIQPQLSSSSDAAERDIVITKGNSQFFCRKCEVPISGEKARREHIESDKHKQKGACSTASATVDTGDPHIVPTSIKNQFRCTLCSVPISGEKALIDHRESEKHIQKMPPKQHTNQMQQPTPPQTTLPAGQNYLPFDFRGNESRNEPQFLTQQSQHSQLQPLNQQYYQQPQSQPTIQSHNQPLVSSSNQPLTPEIVATQLTDLRSAIATASRHFDFAKLSALVRSQANPPLSLRDLSRQRTSEQLLMRLAMADSLDVAGQLLRTVEALADFHRALRILRRLTND